VDDARIAALTAEVLADLRAPAAGAPPSGLEARVAALETAVRALQSGAAAVGAVVAAGASASAAGAVVHPSLRLLGPSGGTGGACVLEPDKPCVGSGQCRTFGH